jgi:hypothetical protein
LEQSRDFSIEDEFRTLVGELLDATGKTELPAALIMSH